jgi:hypothetical protein
MKLTKNDFASSFGIDPSEINRDTEQIINQLNFEIVKIVDDERDDLILRIIEKIRFDEQVIAAPERKNVWERGWAENLAEYIESRGNLETLVPKFIRKGEIIRWFGDYYRTLDENFELNYISVLRSFLFSKYFGKIDSLYEFGAGTGFNLVHAGSIRPEIKLVGTDFVQSPVDLMNRVGNDLKINLSAQVFDMLEPKKSNLQLDLNSGVLTFGSLEQLGSKLSNMIQYLINENPSVCVHIEPMIEMYDVSNLPDYLASWFQSKRGYSSGLISLLEDLSLQGKLEILEVQRLNFGSLMMEGYNLIAWRPKK